MARNRTTNTLNVDANVQNASPPGDLSILKPWLNFVRAARAKANAGTHTVLTFHIITDERRRPVHYICTHAGKMEPRAGVNELNELLEVLSG